MTDENTQFYLDLIKREIAKLEEGKFYGSIEFRVNLIDGGIKFLNVHLNKTVKRFEREYKVE